MAEYREGQRLQGSDGQIYVVVNGVPTLAAAAPTAPAGVVVAPSPAKLAERAEENARKDRTEARQDANAGRQATAAERQADAAERTASNQNFDNVQKLRSAYESLPAVKEYRVAIAQMAAATKRAPNATGDNSLIYDYAKAMDPGSVVREAEMSMAGSADSVIERAAAGYKKQFGLEGGGSLSQNVRDQLRREMLQKVITQRTMYEAQRARMADDAKAEGIDPDRVIGPHDGAAFRADLKKYNEERGSARVDIDKRLQSTVDGLIRVGDWGGANKALVAAGKPPISLGERAKIQTFLKENPGKPISAIGTKVPALDYAAASGGDDGGYEQSIVGQGMSGVNKGIASILGAPVDLMTGAVNLGTTGINALTNSDIPRIDNPTLGSQWVRDNVMSPLGAIGPNATTTGGQVASRVGESIGAAAFPAAMAGTAMRAGGQLLAGGAGGVGGATAQQVFPGNPYAEMAGEVLGGGAAAGGLMRGAQRRAQGEIEAAVPSVEQLKQEAGQLYRQAEARGVVADPQDTAILANNFRNALAAEGNISPTGRISDVYPKAKEAQQLMDDYAGSPMNPTQMQTVRRIASDGMSSAEPTERRLGKILTSTFDEWANPLAPELQDARDVSSRYLTAETLGRARELAGARASQFTGSGFENALRTEYRGLDRAEVKDQQMFSPDVLEAIQKVSRGTPTSNFARDLGRLAPTGPVSGLGSVVPGLGVGALTSPGIGAAVGGAMAGAGILGRAVATNMGIRAADEAELIARNGGALPQAEFATPEQLRMIRGLALAEAAKYQNQ